MYVLTHNKNTVVKNETNYSPTSWTLTRSQALSTYNVRPEGLEMIWKRFTFYETLKISQELLFSLFYFCEADLKIFQHEGIVFEKENATKQPCYDFNLVEQKNKNK